MHNTIGLRAKKSLDFICDHPAFAYDNGDSLGAGIWFMMAPCCKRGHLEGDVTIYNDNPRWNEFRHLLDNGDVDSDLKSVDVPYELMYGEQWNYDHIEYWYEITFFVFTGNPYINSEQYEATKWSRYGGPSNSANSFEEMLIDIEEKVKECFGDFNQESFYQPEEIEYQKNNERVIFTAPDALTKTTQMIFKDDYVDVTEGLINLRWLEWYMKTDDANKNWKFEFNAWNELLNRCKKNEPDQRKQLLAPYKCL